VNEGLKPAGYEPDWVRSLDLNVDIMDIGNPIFGLETLIFMNPIRMCSSFIGSKWQIFILKALESIISGKSSSL
jgi:hypothetical protein